MITSTAQKQSNAPPPIKSKRACLAQCTVKNGTAENKDICKKGTKSHRIADLIKKLKYFTEPDFSAGNDFWPRMDSRLNGQIHLIIQQAIAALDESHHGLKE